MHKKKLKNLKMDAVNESRQGALTAANFKLTTANYTLDAAKDNFHYSKKPLGSKGNFSNLSLVVVAKIPFRCSEFTRS